MMLLGAILAGGGATRFGSDKALALLDGQSLIEHAARALRPGVSSIVVCGRASGPAGSTPLADWPAPDLGPLGGLCAALRYAHAFGFAGVLSIGCDTPQVPRSLLERLSAGAAPAFLQHVPIIGYWPADLADCLSRHLSDGGDRSVRRWAASIGARAIDAGGELANINAPADLTALAAGSHG